MGSPPRKWTPAPPLWEQVKALSERCRELEQSHELDRRTFERLKAENDQLKRLLGKQTLEDSYGT